MQAQSFLLVVGLDSPRRIVFVSSGEALMKYLGGTGLIATIRESTLHGSTLRMVLNNRENAVRIQTHFRNKHGYGRSYLTVPEAEAALQN